MDKEPKSDVCGEAPDPNKETAGAEAVGVENREDDEAAMTGVLKSEDPLAAELVETMAGVCGAVDVPGAAEPENNPVT